MPSLSDLKIQLYADGADFAQMVALNQHPLIKGFTTNPSLLLKAGESDYCGFARRVLEMIPDKPISFEVLADDLPEIERQARKLSTWGANVWVKIPVTTTKGESIIPLFIDLMRAEIQLNVTAIMTTAQVFHLLQAARFVKSIYGITPRVILSVFAGRIADTGVRPSRHIFPRHDQCAGVRYLWASTREVVNIFEAWETDYDIITVTMEQIKKLDLIGKDLTEYSRETVAQFYRDGQKAGLLL